MLKVDCTSMFIYTTNIVELSLFLGISYMLVEILLDLMVDKSSQNYFYVDYFSIFKKHFFVEFYFLGV